MKEFEEAYIKFANAVSEEYHEKIEKRMIRIVEWLLKVIKKLLRSGEK